MKKLLIIAFMLGFCSLGTFAQSGMTDEQVMQFVVKEYEKGTSQAQIVTKLMQRGVDINQIRRVKNTYERMKNKQGLGTVEDAKSAQSRLRNSNGDKKEQSVQEMELQRMQAQRKSSLRLQGTNETRHTYDEADEDFMEMSGQLKNMLPDSLEMIYMKENKRKVFGRDIFNNKNLTFEPNMNIATPQNYRLGPGDAVFIDIYGASQRTIESTVSPDGTVTIEGFGPVQVSGMTVSQANAQLRSTLGTRYSSSQIRLTVGQTRTIMVNVMGEVKAPGTYTLSAFASVFHALYMAGGVNDLGTLRNIKVFRNNRLISTVDIYDYILNGKLTGNVRLAENDVIVVGPYDCLVNITGKVKRPMFYEMRRNESVGTLMKYSGGFTGDAYTKSVRLVRKTGREYSVYNVDEFDMSSFHLTDEDSVSVDSIIPRFSNMAEVKGAVFRPGMYQVGGNITTIRELLECCEGVTEEAFIAHAVMHRMKEDRTLQVIPVDIDGIVSGKIPDIALKPNDVLFIPTKQEMMEERTITIHGEVHYPGVYKYADNETLEDFVLQAGGLKQTASTVKVDVARRISNPKAYSTDSIIARTYSFALKDGFVIDGEQGFTLMPFDEVYVRKSPGFYKQQNVIVEGEVMFGGTYTLERKNQRLSDLIKASGGVNDRAYTKGARLERRFTPEERMRTETLLNMAKSNTNDKDSINIKKIDIGDVYYVGIELDKALAEPGGDEDIVLREGDRLIVPQYTSTVKVSGDVMYPNTVGYQKGKKAGYYINQAGGWGNRAKKNHTFIIYMNGKVARVAHNAKPEPGCEIFVPSKAQRDPRMLAQTISLASSVASFATIIATLANIIKK
ncbi:SLBB domain-containing protein [Prevotella sp. OH937_COT-195]|uniref:SLBB domain-containing protein n=1 Tax=Prevotella sp. OH937_COT-195 TaxID=2491051 RepID=UPI000F649AED|nr:SLBB domain-containing protein [Prevotella sp. OH937_COT-195]RRD02768.1 capsule biosynthesis protein [Prevotella sp. OH937_COT-195]